MRSMPPASLPRRNDLVVSLVQSSPGFTFFRVIDVPVGIFLAQLPAERLRIVHLPEIRPYRPLPLFREDTIVQHYMQPEEFKQFHERALAAADAASAGGGGSSAPRAAQDDAAALVYDMFVKAKVLRR